ncbi:MAG TPA: DUF4214 domain-containing protein, partial [Pyrinomonadaceae bacterium]
MYHRVAHRLTLRTAIALTLCFALLPFPSVSLLISGAAQAQNHRGRPRPGRPDGVLPNLDEIREESQIEREAPPPVPSTIRAKKNEGKPWDGRRVGDPEPPGSNRTERGSAGSIVATRLARTMRRAHARAVKPPPPLPDNQFVQNFFTWALTINPTSSETTYWYDQLRVAYAQGQTSLKLAAIELGRTLFESAAYAARNRDAHWYVYDLYKSYLMRDPDPGGWATWESLVPTYGREYVRRGFEESAEFATIVATVTPNGSATSAVASLTSAQVDPRNQPGNGMLTRDASWSVPLLSLPGRAGLNLGLVLSYSSMVWTRSGPYIYFDEDNGFPSPGFRLGFPTVQRKVFDAQTARNAYLLITGSGHRVELRQVGTSNLYDAADSSYLRLTENVGNLWVHSTDGTRLTFSEVNGEFRCVEIKDRNGNYLTVSYNTLGHISTITDTLSRVITFNYDGNANLLSITQAWPGQTAHQWVGLSWGTRTMQSSFTSGAVVGTANGAVLPVITQVTLNDTSYFTFDYTNSLQVSQIRNYFGALERNSTTFTYETPAGDAPHLLDSRVSAHNWSGYNNVPSQVITQYSVAGDGACVMTAPDGTVYKQYYGTGWQKGLTTLSEVWSGGVRQKWITTSWTQDNTAVGYEMNPRVTETNVYDASGNRRRTTIDYGPSQYVQYGLPYAVTEYAADGATAMRQTLTDYNLSQAYVDRRIIGLVSAVHQTNISSWQRKVTYIYDEPARLEAVPAAATQHDTAYSTSFTARGNVTAVSRWDVTDIVNAAKTLTTYTNYYDTGTPKSTTDPAGHTNSITYNDSFSDTLNRNTFAYPTTLTDADGFSSTVQYNFELGATTRTQSPSPAGQTQGAIQSMTYNNLAQLERVTTTNNGAYKRFWYGAEFTASYTTVNNIADEAYSVQVTDGLGQVIGAVRNHPGSTGGYSLVNTVHNLMGRAWLRSNPTEVDATWAPRGDDQAGAYYTQQTYDWQGRPLITTNPDLTTKEASYSGCGCAGGAVLTLTDEGTISGGVAKRRQQRIYSDVLGRTLKTEVLNWQGGTVYTATVNTYNARDQLTQVRQYAGAEGSPAFQDTTMTYDGYGRLKSKHVPEQIAGTSTTWDYNPDDTLQKVTDARGASTTLSYIGNNRKLVSSVTHALSGSPTIVSSFAYDAAGNRTSMTDALGSVEYQYHQLSQLKAEIRTFTGVSNPSASDGKFKLSYDYNFAGALKKFTDASNMSIVYGYDNAARITSVIGADNLYANVSQYASSFSYRAWSALKNFTDGTNHVISRSYNARLQTSQFAISGNVVTQTFDYFNDGRIKFLDNVLDGNFDRSFSYDQVGRLVAAASGGAARQDAGAVPYNQTFGYDAFSNLNARYTGTWNQFSSSDSAVYVNNRRGGWQYDNDGRNTGIEERDYYFDSAGQGTRLEAPMWISALEAYITKVMDSNYDGDGQKVKEVTWDYFAYQPTLTRYYLRSSVLGGALIEEIDGSGQKQVGYVYAGNRVLAKQSNSQVSWKHISPAGTSEYDSVSFGGYARTELDPFGADVTLSPTPPPEHPPAPGELGQTHFAGIMDSRVADIFDINGCVVEGSAQSCSVAAAMVNFGTGAAGGLLAMGLSMASLNESLPLRAVSTGVQTITFNVSGTEGRTTYETVWSDYLNQWVPHTPTAYSGTPSMVISSALAPSLVPTAQTVRRLTQYEIDKIRNDMIKTLNNPGCAEFIAATLNQVAKDTGVPLLSDDPVANFDEVVRTGTLEATVLDRGEAQSWGSAGGGDATIQFNTRYTLLSPFAHLAGIRLIHETTHVSTNKKGTGYGDYVLARASYKAALKLNYKDVPAPPETYDAMANGN